MVKYKELIECLRFIRGHLYAATVQLQPNDDKIISEHIEEAYVRCKEILQELEQIPEGKNADAWIEHHKAGDNLLWDMPHKPCTPLYAGIRLNEHD